MAAKDIGNQLIRENNAKEIKKNNDIDTGSNIFRAAQHSAQQSRTTGIANIYEIAYDFSCNYESYESYLIKAKNKIDEGTNKVKIAKDKATQIENEAKQTLENTICAPQRIIKEKRDGYLSFQKNRAYYINYTSYRPQISDDKEENDIIQNANLVFASTIKDSKDELLKTENDLITSKNHYNSLLPLKSK